MKLTLNDLCPKETTLELNGKKYELKRFTLRAQAWAFDKYGPDKLNDLLSKQHLPTVAEILHYLLKDKTDFPTAEDLMECVATQHERVSLFTALLETIGISQPILDKILKEEGESVPSKKSTGRKSTTSSQANTAIK